MALPPISGQAVSPQGQPTRSVADARAAQRAFFEAALGKAQAPAATQAVERPAAVTARASPQTPPAQAAPVQTDAGPNRPVRPGSLVNIVV